MMPCAGSPRPGRRAGGCDGRGLCPALLCARRGLPFDWSHEVILLSGLTVTVKVAHVRPCHSRMMPVRAYFGAGSGKDMVKSFVLGQDHIDLGTFLGASQTISGTTPVLRLDADTTVTSSGFTGAAQWSFDALLA